VLQVPRVPMLAVAPWQQSDEEGPLSPGPGLDPHDEYSACSEREEQEQQEEEQGEQEEQEEVFLQPSGSGQEET